MCAFVHIKIKFAFTIPFFGTEFLVHFTGGGVLQRSLQPPFPCNPTRPDSSPCSRTRPFPPLFLGSSFWHDFVEIRLRAEPPNPHPILNATVTLTPFLESHLAPQLQISTPLQHVMSIGRILWWHIRIGPNGT